MNERIDSPQGITRRRWLLAGAVAVVMAGIAFLLFPADADGPAGRRHSAINRVHTDQRILRVGPDAYLVDDAATPTINTATPSPSDEPTPPLLISRTPHPGAYTYDPSNGTVDPGFSRVRQ